MYSLTSVCSLSGPGFCVAETPSWSDAYYQFRPAMLRRALAILGNAADAEDAVQDAFVCALERPGGLRDPSAQRGWLLAVTRNVAITRVRRRHVRRAGPLEPALLCDPRVGEPGGVLELQGALHGLTPALKSAALAATTGHTLAEYASAEGIAYGAAKTRISRARAVLRRQLMP